MIVFLLFFSVMASDVSQRKNETEKQLSEGKT